MKKKDFITPGLRPGLELLFTQPSVVVIVDKEVVQTEKDEDIFCRTCKFTKFLTESGHQVDWRTGVDCHPGCIVHTAPKLCFPEEVYLHQNKKGRNPRVTYFENVTLKL